MRDYLRQVCTESSAISENLAAFEGTLSDLRQRFNTPSLLFTARSTSCRCRFSKLLHWMGLCNADANSWPSRLRQQDGHFTSVSVSLMGLAVMRKGAPVFLPARPS
jgi:hypothetical protein